MPLCIEYPPDMVGENYLPPSGSFYGFTILGEFGITWEQSIQRIRDSLTEMERRVFLYGEWASDQFTESLERSRSVLMEHLNENQRANFEVYSSFFVNGSESGQLYRIYKNESYSIELIKDGIFMCATTHHEVPIYDEMLIFKLFLETDEYKFVQQCNFKDQQEGEKVYKTIGLRKKPSWRQYLPF